MGEFLQLKSPTQAHQILAAFTALDRERVALADAAGRVLGEDLVAPEDSPPWSRSVMDGYAVRAQDTFGASDTVPVFLKVKGTVPMGSEWAGVLGPGEAVGISTGGVLPEGADAVVMVEYTQRGTGCEIEVARAVATGDNVIRRGEDLAEGALMLRCGQRLRAQDVGVLSSFGIVGVSVYRQPVVGILSTGTELVPTDATPRRGQIRCMNQLTLAAQVSKAGGIPVRAGIVADDMDAITERTSELVERCDVVLLSGGSSIGVRDLTGQVLERLGAETLFHGISVRPGKPTVVARKNQKPILGMPGVPVSAMVIFDVFVRPLLWRLEGENEREPWPARRAARMTRQLASVPGREDYVRARLVQRDDGAWAEPLMGGSAMTSTLLFADGRVCIPQNSEGV
ncbi:MAG: gephyrin-like molybdotransferase Glp, partial [Chloroflexota bacterium]